MSRKRETSSDGAVWRPGLKVRDEGHAGVVLELTDDHLLAEARHERVLAAIDKFSTSGTRHHGGLLLLQLPANEFVLTETSLWLATAPGATFYAHDQDHYLDWTDANGWQDRRLLSQATADSINRNGGLAVSLVDRRWASRTLRSLVPEARGEDVWKAFISDAQSWWYSRASRPVLDHAMGLRRLQVLPKAAFARKLSGLAEIAPETSPDLALLPSCMAEFPGTGHRDSGSRSIEDLIAFTATLANDNKAKPVVRSETVEHIELLMPLAATECQANVHALGAFRHALLAGGATGRLWAPRTTAEYAGVALRPIVEKLKTIDPDEFSGLMFHGLYTECLQKIKTPSARKKFSAFVHVFHRYMVMCGAEPMPLPLLPGEVLQPPAAAIVGASDLEWALKYVAVHARDKQMRLQGHIILRLGLLVAMRTYEYWCLRVGDIQGKERMTLVIYPRAADGVCKSPYLRRMEDIHARALCRDLLELQRLRRAVHAQDEDVLFGESGTTHGRYREVATNNLVNAALRWATGNPRSSIYDLRHTYFSHVAAKFL